MVEHTIITAKHYAYITIKQSPDLATFIRASRRFVVDPDSSASLNRVSRSGRCGERSSLRVDAMRTCGRPIQ